MEKKRYIFSKDDIRVVFTFYISNQFWFVISLNIWTSCLTFPLQTVNYYTTNELDYHLDDNSTGKVAKPFFFFIFASHILQCKPGINTSNENKLQPVIFLTYKQIAIDVY